jgi:hypothetical protein
MLVCAIVTLPCPGTQAGAADEEPGAAGAAEGEVEVDGDGAAGGVRRRTRRDA